MIDIWVSLVCIMLVYGGLKRFCHEVMDNNHTRVSIPVEPKGPHKIPNRCVKGIAVAI